MPFEGTLAAGVECGQSVPFSLALATSAGPATLPFSVPTGEPGPWTSHDATDVPEPVNDVATSTSSLTVDQQGRIKRLRVRIGQLNHPNVSDLELRLVAPDGSSVLLFDGDDVGGELHRHGLRHGRADVDRDGERSLHGQLPAARRSRCARRPAHGRRVEAAGRRPRGARRGHARQLGPRCAPRDLLRRAAGELHGDPEPRAAVDGGRLRRLRLGRSLRDRSSGTSGTSTATGRSSSIPGPTRPSSTAIRRRALGPCACA